MNSSSVSPPPGGSNGRPIALRLLLGSCVLLVLLGLVRWLRRDEPVNGSPSASSNVAAGGRQGSVREQWLGRFIHRRAEAQEPPAMVVSRKMTQFARGRLSLAEAMARQRHTSVPAEVRRFFALVEGGRWEDIDALFNQLSKRHREEPRSPELDAIWSAIHETYGVAEQVHLWPAQKLLDYGQAVLGSLRPGMVYVGGTDPGRFIPTLLSETSEGEHHVVVTQNALADNSYLDYLKFQYGDRLQALTPEDSQEAFKTYLTDAQKRLEHDQRFPDQPKLVRPGEDIQVIDHRVQVSGQVAVMAINEKLLQALMQKNPALPFAMEESFALKTTYVGAAPLGPILELRAADAQNPLSAERAEQSLQYWRATAAQLSMDPEAPDGSETRKAWAHMAMAQGNLFAGQDLPAAAEEAYRVATDLWSAIPEATFGLAELMARTGRTDAAQQLLDDFARRNPDQLAAVERSRQMLHGSPPALR